MCLAMQVNSFEVFGFDVLVDSQLRSWLIEVCVCVIVWAGGWVGGWLDGWMNGWVGV